MPSSEKLIRAHQPTGRSGSPGGIGTRAVRIATAPSPSIASRELAARLRSMRSSSPGARRTRGTPPSEATLRLTGSPRVRRRRGSESTSRDVDGDRIEGGRVRRLLVEQAPAQGGAALGRVADLLGAGALLRVRRGLVDLSGADEDHREEVVEVMRHARRHQAEALEIAGSRRSGHGLGGPVEARPLAGARARAGRPWACLLSRHVTDGVPMHPTAISSPRPPHSLVRRARRRPPSPRALPPAGPAPRSRAARAPG